MYWNICSSDECKKCGAIKSWPPAECILLEDVMSSTFLQLHPPPPLFLVFLSLIFLFFGFLSFWLSHTSLWKPGDSVLPRPKSTHFCTPTHLSCALHLCVLSLEMTLFLPTSLSSLSLFPLISLRGGRGPQFPLMSFSSFTSPSPSSLPLKWVVFAADESKVSLKGRKHSHLACLSFFSTQHDNLCPYASFLFIYFLTVSFFVCCEVECIKRKCSIWLGSYWPCYSQALSAVVVFS